MKIGSTAAPGVGVSAKAILERVPIQNPLGYPLPQGLILEGVGYRQSVVVRSYEIGHEKTMMPQYILNLLQETYLNHQWMSGLHGDGFGATHGMMKNDLIWDITRMQVQVDHIWVMMNEKTRQLSKMPHDVRAEMSPWFIKKQAIKEQSPKKVDKLNYNPRYVMADLRPKRGDLDMDNYVNNVKYVRCSIDVGPMEGIELLDE
ncbi:hypothetical protein L1987_65560 [Smallanthus sonchifolius]|uniref:Uncharacterized protein n=1 Tax=Smallanthus sonchifolius TaxID=185202 RepID=A0ACB9BV07_9ASTR|nr:hypothetical protein L1987_65560 [Smallanthus sonchifolius]